MEFCQALVSAASMVAGSAERSGRLASRLSRFWRDATAAWKVCGSWCRFGPHWLTSLTAATMELRSVTLCARSPARLWAACCCAGWAVGEEAGAEADEDVVPPGGTGLAGPGAGPR